MNSNCEFHKLFIYMGKNKIISLDEMTIIAIIAKRIQSQLEKLVDDDKALDALFDENKDMKVVIDENILKETGSSLKEKRLKEAVKSLKNKELPLAEKGLHFAKIIKDVEELWSTNQLRLTICNAFLPYLAGAKYSNMLQMRGYCSVVTENGEILYR